MAYGDGSFFFTQPVGNGYSGLGSFQPRVKTGGRSLSPASRMGNQVSSHCLVAGASCTLAEVEAELARVAALRDLGVRRSWASIVFGTPCSQRWLLVRPPLRKTPRPWVLW